jgi:hypothetical protein
MTKTPEVGDLWIEEDNDYKRMTYVSLFEYGLVFGVNDDGRVLWGSNIEYFLKNTNISAKAKLTLTNCLRCKNEF